MGPRAIVVCVGSDIVGDDAFGGAVHDRLAGLALPERVRLERVSLGGLGLVDLLDGEDLMIVVDAVCLGGPLGALRWMEWDEIPIALGPAVSCHGIGVREAVEVARRLFPAQAPRRVVLCGVEGERFCELGEPMSPAVADAVGPAVARILSEIGA